MDRAQRDEEEARLLAAGDHAALLAAHYPTILLRLRVRRSPLPTLDPPPPHLRIAAEASVKQPLTPTITTALAGAHLPTLRRMLRGAAAT